MPTAAPEEKRATIALAPMPAAPALWSPANMLPEATAPPYTVDWTPAATEPAATPAAVNPAAERTKGAPTAAIVPPTKPEVANSFQHHPPLFESSKKKRVFVKQIGTSGYGKKGARFCRIYFCVKFEIVEIVCSKNREGLQFQIKFRLRGFKWGRVLWFK